MKLELKKYGTSEEITLNLNVNSTLNPSDQYVVFSGGYSFTDNDKMVESKRYLIKKLISIVYGTAEIENQKFNLVIGQVLIDNYIYPFIIDQDNTPHCFLTESNSYEFYYESFVFVNYNEYRSYCNMIRDEALPFDQYVIGVLNEEIDLTFFKADLSNKKIVPGELISKHDFDNKVF